jgi:hypothetical protein
LKSLIFRVLFGVEPDVSEERIASIFRVEE